MKARLLAIAAATALALPILPGRVYAQEVQKTPAVQDSISVVKAALDTAKSAVVTVDSAVAAVADTLADKAQAAVAAVADTVKAEAEKAVSAAVETAKVEAEQAVAAAVDTVKAEAEAAVAAAVDTVQTTVVAVAQESEKTVAAKTEKAAKKVKEKKAKAEKPAKAAKEQVVAATDKAAEDAAIVAAAAQLLAQANANQAAVAAQPAQPAPNGVVADDAAMAAAAAKAAELARAQEKEAAMKMEADNARLRAMEAEEHRRELKKAERDGRRTVKGRRYKFFNHLGVGAIAGLDGAGIDVAVPIYGHLQLRGGYSFLPKQLGVKKSFDLGTYDVNGTDRDFKNISFELKPDMATYKAFLDFYPTRWTAFHITVGAYYGVKSSDFFTLTADLRGPLQPNEYASVYVQLDDKNEPGKYARISTDEKGFAHVAVRSKQEIRPYVGIGFGRCANLKHRVSVNFELGAQYIKGVGIEVYDYDGNGQYLTSGMVDNKDEVDNPLTGKKLRVIDALGKDLNIWPVMRFGINVRLF
ncbi:MAG: hypothetical protein J5771_04515 [Bacteroidales bacterium]|nr:hypothetical protein [Bacteroidales bacterium]